MAAVAACVVAAEARAEAAARMTVVAAQDIEFRPLNPERPEAGRFAVLWGSPGTAPSALMLRLARGGGGLHVHSSDYHLVVLEGAMRHLASGEAPDEATPLGPGSYWHQPGGEAHSDECLSDVCLLFVKWEGPFDSVLVDDSPESRLEP